MEIGILMFKILIGMVMFDLVLLVFLILKVFHKTNDGIPTQDCAELEPYQDHDIGQDGKCRTCGKNFRQDNY